MASLCLSWCAKSRGLEPAPSGTKEGAALAGPKATSSTKAAQTAQSPFNLEVVSLWSLHKVHLSVLQTPAFYSVLQYLNPLIK